MASSSKATSFISENTHLLPRAKVHEMIDMLKMRKFKVLDFMKEKISGSHHLTVFPQRQQFWEQCMLTPELETFVLALFDEYVSLLLECHKGKEKYGQLQVHWMECLRIIQFEHESLTLPAVHWRELMTKTKGSPSSSTTSAILSCITHSVFSFCQHTIVNIKEEELESVEEDVGPLQEAGLTADESALYRLGGFAPHASIESSEKLHPDVVAVLKGIRLPLSEKVDLPTNIQHLDSVGMTFMKREMLGYLSKVHEKMKLKTSKDFIQKLGSSVIKVMEDDLLADQELQRAFHFGCCEVEVGGEGVSKAHQLLLRRMIHTHGNELVESKRMLDGIDTGKLVEAPLMLRDTLKVLATQPKSHSDS